MYLDQLVTLVGRLESRLDLLLDVAQTNHNTIETMASTYDKIREMDAQIHYLDAAVTRTQSWLHDFSSLHEQSIYLESLISRGDIESSKALLDAMSTEYQTLLESRANLIENKQVSMIPCISVASPLADIDDDIILSEQQPHVIEKMPSISQLKLKPLRCNSKQLYKKKSRYKLSALYDVNPIASDESPRLPVEYSDGESSPYTSPAGFDSHHGTTPNETLPKMQIVFTNKRVTSTLSYDSPANATEASFTGVHSISCFTEDTEAGLLLFEEANFDIDMRTPIYTRHRSNSVPCIGQENATDSILAEGDTQIGHQAKDKSLMHFISYPRIPLANRNSVLQCDEESLMSVISFEDEEDPYMSKIDFSAYLRQPPQEHNEGFSLRRSKSLDSIFDEPKTAVKFHNPAERLRPKVRILSPTLDSAMPVATPVNIPQSGDSRSLLTHVMQQNRPLLAVDTPSPRDSVKIQPVPEVSSVELFGKSFTNSFRSFLNVPPKVNKQKLPPKAVRFDIPQAPIHAPNHIQEKRMPINIPRTDGAHSQLTIGPGQARSIKHGDSLVFRRPAALNLRADHLQDALKHKFI